MIQHVQDDGWTRLRRGSVKRKGPHATIAFIVTVLIVVATFIIFATLRLPSLLTFIAILGVFAAVGSGLSTVSELLWGVGAVVSVSRQPVRAGEAFRVRCTIARPERAREVTVVWQGREEAVLRGYDTTRFVEPFLRQTLIDVQNTSVSVEIPPDAMPSFNGKNVRIVWSVVVEARTGAGLTQNDFPMLVVPARS